jgi:hypothetical protein
MSQELARPMPRPPANVAPYVAALGPDAAVRFLLAFGGAEFYFAARPGPDNAAVDVIGIDGVRALAAFSDKLHQRQRVPLANRWLAKMLAWQGHSIAEIARRLRASDSTVRKWVRDGAVR